MKIGIYGGSFNPPHIAHLHVADLIMTQTKLDHIIFIPAGDPYMKDRKDMAPAEDRFNMVQLAIRGEDKYSVSDIEIKREGPTYTADTICELRAKYFMDDELYLIVGQDAFMQMPKWHEVDKILSYCDLIVVLRGTDELEIPYGFGKYVRYVLYPGVGLDLSSTQIRECVKRGITVKGFVPSEVDKYIKEHNLYR